MEYIEIREEHWKRRSESEQRFEFSWGSWCPSAKSIVSREEEKDVVIVLKEWEILEEDEFTRRGVVVQELEEW